MPMPITSEAIQRLALIKTERTAAPVAQSAAETTLKQSARTAARDRLERSAQTAFRVSEGNHVEAVIDGKQVLSEALSIIRGAQKSIRFQTYLFGGDSGKQIAEALAERQKAGVKVQVVLSPNRKMVGAEDEGKALKYLEEHVTDIRSYPTELLANDMPKWRRGMTINHAKMLVADDHVAMVGGINFSDEGLKCHDFMLKVRGPAAKDFGSMSAEDWRLAGGDTSVSIKPNAPEGGAKVTIAESSPTRRSISALMTKQFDQAKKSIDVYAFLLDDPALMKSLLDAKNRGVQVRVMMDQTAVMQILDHVPGGQRLKKYDVGTIMNLPTIKQLGQEGIPVKLFDPHDGLSCLHGKVAVIDGESTVVGSANFTTQAMSRNRELAVAVNDPKLAQKYGGSFEQDWNRYSEPARPLAPWQDRTARFLSCFKHFVYGQH